VVTGHRFLGGLIGGHRERKEYKVSKVRRWVGHINYSINLNMNLKNADTKETVLNTVEINRTNL